MEYMESKMQDLIQVGIEESEREPIGIHSGDFASYQKASGLSRSMLREMAWPRTPAHFKAKFIDKVVSEETTPAMELGTLTHRVILEPESCENAFHVKPEGMKFSNKEGIAWRDAHQYRSIITAEQAAAMRGMRESVLAHPIARKFIERSLLEQNVFSDDGGIRLKARLDMLPDSGNSLADLKTCESADDLGFSKSIDSYAYHYQAAFYLDVCKLAGRDFSQWIFIAVEKEPPFLCVVYNLDQLAIEYGRRLYRRDLQVYRNCLESGIWPGYPADLSEISLPQYRQREMENFS